MAATAEEAQVPIAEEDAQQQRTQEAEVEEGPGPVHEGLQGLHGDMFTAIWAALDKRSRQALRLTCKGLHGAASQHMCSLTLTQPQGQVDKLVRFASIGCLRYLQVKYSLQHLKALQFIGGVWKSKQAQAALLGLRSLTLVGVDKHSRNITEALIALTPQLHTLCLDGIYSPFDAQDLSALSKLCSIELKGAALHQPVSRESLSALTGLTHLRLEGLSWFPAEEEGLTAATYTSLRRLQSLELIRMGRLDLQDLAGSCAGLTHLRLEHADVCTAHLRLFPSLQSLHLNRCSRESQQQVQDCAQLTGLTALSISPPLYEQQDNMPPLDLSPLSALTGLKDLRVGLTAGHGSAAVLDTALRSCSQLLTGLQLVPGPGWAFRPQTLQGLHRLQSLDLDLEQPWGQVQSALHEIAALTTLTHLRLDKTFRQGGDVLRYSFAGHGAESNRATPSLDLSPLSRLVRLRELQLDCEEEWVCGLPALGVACPQLAQVHIECKGLATAVAGSAAVPDGGSAAGQGSSGSGAPGTQSSGALAKAGDGPDLWPSLQSITFADHGEHRAWHEPGAVAALQLHRAPNLSTLEGVYQFTLERGGHESSPAALRAACESLADCYSSVRTPCEQLRLSRSAFNEPLRQYLAALTPLAHYVTRFSLRDLERASKADWDALYDTFPQLLMAKQAKQ